MKVTLNACHDILQQLLSRRMVLTSTALKHGNSIARNAKCVVHQDQFVLMAVQGGRRQVVLHY